MRAEELHQAGYLTGGLHGVPYGSFEQLTLGATNLATLKEAGLDFSIASSLPFTPSVYRLPRRISSIKPDHVFARRSGNLLTPVAVAEWKSPSEYARARDKASAQEQAVCAALAMGLRWAIATDGRTFDYIDAIESAAVGKIVLLDESRDLTPGFLYDLVYEELDAMRDPRPLAESVWQLIWHATKAEPKECLLTFVEIFMLKFLSDNLPLRDLPANYRFDALMTGVTEFQALHGTTQIEYYAREIRPRLAGLFPSDTHVSDQRTLELFGLDSLQSPTSILNGFAFGENPGPTFNGTFLGILKQFQEFGPLGHVDPEFKLRLYETFLRRSARQQRLGQFFTPRNIVAPIIRMAELSTLDDGAVVLDPAAGVGGFLLEPLLMPEAAPGNFTFTDGVMSRRLKLIGIDVDTPTNVLAKANLLLHLAEEVRNPDTTNEALNAAAVETFLLMKENETLGSLLNPPRDSIDRILTNPPYVTQGSGIYKRALQEVSGHRNGAYLSEYYDTGGLGLEALFLRYISGALKPGGRAFVVVPLGLLTRTASRMKENLLNECNIIASIELPRNAFFNTSQPTCILGLEKRRTRHQSRPAVFCGIARTIGETLDHERVPTPDDNDLDTLSRLFVQSQADRSVQHEGVWRYPDCPNAKLVPSRLFQAEDRWDVSHHWTDAEHVALGVKGASVARLEFVTSLSSDLRDLVVELEAAEQELRALEQHPTAVFHLSDPSRFQVRSGVRIRNEDLRAHPGETPVYSVFTKATAVKGWIDKHWVTKRTGATPERYPSVTVMATGASAVGLVHAREAGSLLTDDVVIVQPWPKELLPAPFPSNSGYAPELPQHDIDLGYLEVALAKAIADGNYYYEAKLYTKRVSQLSIEVPVCSDGVTPDIEAQRAIAAAVTRVHRARGQLEDIERRSRQARLS